MRRTTLGPVSSSHLNIRPSSASGEGAAASTAATRMSLGPAKTAVRRSIGPLSGASSRRVSTAARPPAPPPRGSLSRTSVGSGGRRSSAFGARSSMSSRGGPGARIVDPRPLADKAFIAKSIKELSEFLVERGYDHPLLPKNLRGPSRKDVYNMYLFLFQQIDPSFDFGAKFEDDVSTMMRCLRYPFTLSKSTLSAVGTPHTWPHLLGSMTWLVEVLTYNEMTQQPVYSPEEDEVDENGDKVFFEYVDNAYHAFLAGDDNQSSLLEKEEAAKQEEHNRLIAELSMEMERQQLEEKQRIQKAKETKALLPTLRKKKADCEDDLVKFHGYVAQILNGKKLIQERIDKRVAEINELQRVLDERNAEIAVLEKRIDQQEIKADDIEQMTKERARLSEQITLVTQRQKEMQEGIWREETHIAEQMDNVENLVQKYTDTAAEMKLLPLSAKHAYGFDYMIEIDAHRGGVEAASALTNHLKSHVRSALLNFKKNRCDRRTKALDDVLELEDQVQRCRERLNAEELSEQNAAALARKIEANIQRNRQNVDDAIQKKAAETEEVEMEIQAIRDDKDAAEQQTQAVMQLEDAEKKYEGMSSAYTSLIGKSRHQVANALVACTNHKETMEHAILSLEEELASVWP